MGIEHKHAYRFGYLKSEEWKDVRIKRLAKDDAVCAICGTRSLGNDVHHKYYRPNVYHTQFWDLVTLCRDCHEIVHQLLDLMEIKTVSKQKRLFSLINALGQKRQKHPKLGLTATEKRRAARIENAKSLSASEVCKMCLKCPDDLKPRDFLKDLYTVAPDWNFSGWKFCDPCYERFKAEAPLPASNSPAWKAIRIAKDYIKTNAPKKNSLTSFP